MILTNTYFCVRFWTVLPDMQTKVNKIRLRLSNIQSDLTFRFKLLIVYVPTMDLFKQYDSSEGIVHANSVLKDISELTIVIVKVLN